jgi:hypothetical protein
MHWVRKEVLLFFFFTVSISGVGGCHYAKREGAKQLRYPSRARKGVAQITSRSSKSLQIGKMCFQWKLLYFTQSI